MGKCSIASYPTSWFSPGIHGATAANGGKVGRPGSDARVELRGLAFEFLKDTFERIQQNDYVMTGHVDGVITLNIAEADDVERERRRRNLNEDYRTVLGHFRHERERVGAHH